MMFLRVSNMTLFWLAPCLSHKTFQLDSSPHLCAPLTYLQLRHRVSAFLCFALLDYQLVGGKPCVRLLIAFSTEANIVLCLNRYVNI